MTNSTVFGIDLGTTNSCIAVYKNGAFDVISIDGQKTVPSIVGRMGQEWLVGKRAANHGMLYPDQIVRSIKRHMGAADYQAFLGSEAFTPVELSARILGYLKDAAAAATGLTVSDVVITVPAWFNDPQRRATMEAGQKAGLSVLRIINEPTAAALAYDLTGTTAGVERKEGGENWMVYDLGGGTFDVSILAVNGTFKEVLASCGNTFLGGDDFDHRIVLFLTDWLKDRYTLDVTSDRVIMAQLRQAAETAKINLSTYPDVAIQEVLSFAGQTLELDLSLSRARFNEMIADHVESTLHKARQALDQAHLRAGQIDRLLMVGGSTRIPMIRERVAAEFGCEPDGYIDPDLSVALGAAAQAALDRGLSCAQVVVDVSPHTLGVAAYGVEDMRSMGADSEHALPFQDHRHPLTFAPIIRRNTRLPARFVEEFYTGVDNQEGIEVAVYQGESHNTRDNTFISSFRVDLSPMPAGSPIYVGFSYDRSGIISVSVAAESHGNALHTHALDLNRTGAQESLPLGGQEDDVTNFLIEKVTTRLAGATHRDEAVIRALVADYKKALKNDEDDGLDAIEERLYSWLDDTVIDADLV